MKLFKSKVKFDSIKFKISVLYTVIMGIILILYSSILYFSLRYALYKDLDHELMVKAQEISSTINSYLKELGYNQRSFIFSLKRIIRAEGEHPDQDKVGNLEKIWLDTASDLDIRRDYISFVSSRGDSIVSSSNLNKELETLFLKDLKAPKAKAVYYKDTKLKKARFRLITIPFYYKDKMLYFIQIGSSLRPISSVMHAKLVFIILSIPLILLLTSFVGRLIALSILRPVLEITKTAKGITYKDLSTKVESEHADEEMQYLVDSFNDMILRLNKSFKYIAEFSSDVAHELKTPLAIIKGESEVALRKERDAEEYKRVIKITLDEIERMLKTIEDLLLLTRLDYRPEIFKFEQLDFNLFLKDIYEQSRNLVSQKNITLGIKMPKEEINIFADKLHLRRLFLNLINNAVKFTPNKGSIEIALSRMDKRVLVSISDTGIGIRAEDMDKIFNRFFHVDRLNQDVESGSGLGLSIARSIAKRHLGDIKVESRLDKGSTFTVILPIT